MGMTFQIPGTLITPQVCIQQLYIPWGCVFLRISPRRASPSAISDRVVWGGSQLKRNIWIN